MLRECKRTQGTTKIVFFLHRVEKEGPLLIADLLPMKNQKFIALLEWGWGQRWGTKLLQYKGHRPKKIPRQCLDNDITSPCIMCVKCLKIPSTVQYIMTKNLHKNIVRRGGAEHHHNQAELLRVSYFDCP